MPTLLADLLHPHAAAAAVKEKGSLVVAAAVAVRTVCAVCGPGGVFCTQWLRAADVAIVAVVLRKPGAVRLMVVVMLLLLML